MDPESNCCVWCRYISQTQGLPAEHMLNNASKTVKFFYRDRDTTYPFWRLKTPEEHEQVSRERKGFSSLVQYWFICSFIWLTLLFNCHWMRVADPVHFLPDPDQANQNLKPNPDPANKKISFFLLSNSDFFRYFFIDSLNRKNIPINSPEKL